MLQLIALLLLSSFITLQSQEFYPEKWSAKLGLGLNYHISDFDKMPGYGGCCGGFTNGLGLGWQIGMAYRLPSSESSFFKSEIGLSLSSESAVWNEEYFFGNVIYNDRFERGISNHNLDVSLIGVLLNYNVIFDTWIDDFTFKPGIGLFVPLISSFDQKEEATSPSDYTFETGTRQRGVISGGKINDLSPVIANLAFGTDYKLALIDNYDVRLSFDLAYGVNSVVSGLKWNMSSVRLGTIIHFRQAIPTKEEPVIIEIKEPEPVIVQAKIPHLEATNYLNDGIKNYYDGDSLQIQYDRIEFIQSFPIIPIIFYDGENVSNVDYYTGIATNPNRNNQLLQTLGDYLLYQPNVNLKVISTTTKDENLSQAQSRAEKIKSELNSLGIADSRIKIETNIEKLKSDRYQELFDEYENVRLEFSNGQKALYLEQNPPAIYDFTDKKLNLVNEVITDNPPYLVKAEVEFNNGGSVEFPVEEGLKIDRQMLNMPKMFVSTHKLNVRTIITDNANVSVRNGIELNIIPKLRKVDTLRNKEEIGNTTFSRFILAFTDFDKSNLYGIDDNALRLAKAALSNGRNVEIIASSDNLGSEDYNKALAMKRAKAAEKLIGANPKLSITIPSTSPYPNAHPYGRILNRSVTIKIFD